MTKGKSTLFLALSVLLFITLLTYDMYEGQYLKKTFAFIDAKFRGSKNWDSSFEKITIPDENGISDQPAYIYKAKSGAPRPLIISLHTWSGDYEEFDALSQICKNRDLNYIHPNFGGPNVTQDACCSDLVVERIDNAIQYAKSNFNVDTTSIHVVGVSGGGYAALCHFMKSKQLITSYSSWVGISNLEAWYYQSLSRKNIFWEDILDCTGSGEVLDSSKTRARSPIFLPFNPKRQKMITLNLFTGVHDGIRGSVPITQSIDFYNRIVSEFHPDDASGLITSEQTLDLLNYRKPLGNYGSIGDRSLCLVKKSGKIGIYIFDGDHEILPDPSIDFIVGKNN